MEHENKRHASRSTLKDYILTQQKKRQSLPANTTASFNPSVPPTSVPALSAPQTATVSPTIAPTVLTTVPTVPTTTLTAPTTAPTVSMTAPTVLTMHQQLLRLHQLLLRDLLSMYWTLPQHHKLKNHLSLQHLPHLEPTQLIFSLWQMGPMVVLVAKER